MAHRHRPLVAVSVAASLLAVATGCGSGADSNSGTLPSPGVTISLVATPSTPAGTPPVISPPPVTPVPSTSAPTLPAYPTDYAGAIMTAWGGGDNTYLTLLTNAATATHLLHDLAGTDQHWTRINSEGAAGSTFVTYYNQDGDEITLRMVNQETAAHHWHAGSVQTFDAMTYPSDPVGYVKAFVNAWINGNRTRMELLASQQITAHFLGLTKPDSTFTVVEVPGSGAAGHIEYQVKDTAASLDVKLKVATPVVTAGQAHGIEDCDPTCS